MTGLPPFANDWAGLAAVAERLRDDRARADPELVKAGRLSQQQADDRARVSQALALQWRAIARREPMPWLLAGHAEIRRDLESAAAATARRAASKPDLAVQLGAAQTSYKNFAQAVAALLWQQQPYREGAETPRIVFIHEINQHWRSNPVPRTPRPNLAPAPPRRPAPAPAQKGLF